MKKLLMILNPRAGQRRVNRYLPEIIRLFIDHDYRCETYVTGKSGEATRFLAEHGHHSYSMIVCAGCANTARLPRLFNPPEILRIRMNGER